MSVTTWLKSLAQVVCQKAGDYVLAARWRPDRYWSRSSQQDGLHREEQPEHLEYGHVNVETTADSAALPHLPDAVLKGAKLVAATALLAIVGMLLRPRSAPSGGHAFCKVTTQSFYGVGTAPRPSHSGGAAFKRHTFVHALHALLEGLRLPGSHRTSFIAPRNGCSGSALGLQAVGRHKRCKGHGS